jgi:hypothetical protein
LTVVEASQDALDAPAKVVAFDSSWSVSLPFSLFRLRNVVVLDDLVYFWVSEFARASVPSVVLWDTSKQADKANRAIGRIALQHLCVPITVRATWLQLHSAIYAPTRSSLVQAETFLRDLVTHSSEPEMG